ncbi:multicopper oxidase family protein [Lapidilactobacillus luobeiensis]|uniref:multicopper oxidase family protein n=1 Tax=Lapidilactobacillus luobeiensis TaxID=2950371 RepID=UPI0021C4B8B9|nr:multicopper oxidase domain-containing protein [Lapidilactobacillus luobeiensis]
MKTYTDYFFDEPAFNTHDGGYVPLETSKTAPQPLRIPELLQPDRVEGNDVYYTITAQTGSVQMLPGAPTKTWGFNAPFLGQTAVFQNGQTIHLHLVNHLPELTTFHWHGLDIPGPIEDGGCHAPVYPDGSRDVAFKVQQMASTNWLHAHPCPETAAQVYHGLAALAIVQDAHEASLPLPRDYGVDDIPVILQDRRFHEDNQWDYRADYDPDGVQGPTALVNGTVNPYFNVTTQKVRLRILDGANRREWRLHLSDDLPLVQIAGDASLLPEPVALTHVMITCAERQEFVVDFGQYQPGDEVTLYSDETPLLTFRIQDFQPDSRPLPEHLLDLAVPDADPEMPIKKVVLSGMDEAVMIDGTKFVMDRIDYRMPWHKCQIWDIENTNDEMGGMIHPFHMHGTGFKVISRNGHAPYPNETGLKDVVSLNPGEHVQIKVWFNVTGVFMYHCHILEHEDGGMMAQLEVFDPEKPKVQYDLMDHHKMMQAFADERGVEMKDLWLGGMSSYEKMKMHM